MHGSKSKATPEVEAGGDVKRFLIVVAIAALVIWVGAGCKSMPGKLEIDTMFFDVEYENEKVE